VSRTRREKHKTLVRYQKEDTRIRRAVRLHKHIGQIVYVGKYFVFAIPPPNPFPPGPIETHPLTEAANRRKANERIPRSR